MVHYKNQRQDQTLVRLLSAVERLLIRSSLLRPVLSVDQRLVGRQQAYRLRRPEQRQRRLGFFFFKQKTAYEIGLGIPAEPLFRSNILCRVSLFLSMALCLLLRLFVFRLLRLKRFSTLTLKVL